MTENACQTSFPDYQEQKADEELHKLKEENFILQGKIRGYITLGNLLREKKEECSKLKKMNEELMKRITPGTGNISQQNGTHSVNECGVHNKNPGEEKPASVCSENIDVSLKTGHTSNGFIDSKHSNNGTETSKTPPSWVDQMAGVSYPPNDLFQHIKSDKYPTQESINGNCDSKTHRSLGQQSPGHKSPTNVTSNRTEDHNSTENRTVLRSSSTFVHVGSESDMSAGKSLNLMEFPSAHSHELSGSGSNVTNKVVNSSDGSSIQVIKNSVQRQGSRESVLSLHVQNFTELMNGDLGTDGPSSKMKKMLDDILPELTKIELENEELKAENNRLLEENHRLLKRVQQLELSVNNVSPSESMSSQTQVVGWDYVSRAECQKSSTVPEKQQVQTTNQPTKVQPLEHQHGQPSDKPTRQQPENHNSQGIDHPTRQQQLEQQNRELLQANSRWEKMFKEMRIAHENKNRQYEMQIEALRSQLAKRDLEDEKRRCEYDRILLTTKNRLEDEETAREAVQTQLSELQREYEDLQKEKRDLEESLSAVNREHLVSSAELSILRQGMGSMSRQPQHLSSESELRTEIAVLREQLTVFQEDFDRERSDRAKAQSEKDDLNKQLTKLRTENHKLLEQNKRYINQLQTAEINVKDAIEESTRLNSTNMELRSKIRQLESHQQSYSPSFTPNIPTTRPMMVQPETDPYARPSPPYLFHVPMNSVNLPTNRERYPSEQQPGAWNCDDCTFSNHPSRVVCEMCGKIRTQDSNSAMQNPTSSPILWRRGENGVQNDVEADCVR